MTSVNPYSCITYKTAELPRGFNAEPAGNFMAERRTLILKDSSCQVDDKLQEVEIKRPEKGVNLVISQPFSVDGHDPLSKLPINNIYYSMYDPRSLRPKKMRKRSKLVEKKKGDRKGVDFNVEDDEKHEKSFYSNLMKKRPVVNEIIKNLDNSSKGKKGSVKVDITYPYRADEEVNKSLQTSIVPESTTSRAFGAPVTQVEEKTKPQELNIKADIEIQEKKPVLSNDLFKKPEVNVSNGQGLFGNSQNGGLFANKPVEIKKVDVPVPETKPVETKSSLFGQTSDNLFKTKTDDKTPKEPVKENTQTPMPLFGNNQTNTISLFGNNTKKAEDAPKTETKSPQLFNNQSNPFAEAKPEEAPKSLLSFGAKPTNENKPADAVKPSLFANKETNIFNNAENKPAEKSPNLFNNTPNIQNTEFKPLTTSPLGQTPQAKENPEVQKSGGLFNIGQKSTPNLFGSTPSMPFNINPAAPADKKPLDTITEEKNNPFEEEHEDKQHKPQASFPSNPTQNSLFKSPFASPTPQLPPNENPLANSNSNMQTNSFFHNANSFGQQINNGTPPSQRNDNTFSNPSIMGLPTNNQIASPGQMMSNPFIAGHSGKSEQKSPNSFMQSAKPNLFNKSGPASKNTDALSRGINDVTADPMPPGNGVAVGQNSGQLFTSQQAGLFQGGNSQPNNPLFGQGYGVGLQKGSSLFNNNKS